MSDQNNLIAVEGHIIERLPNSDFLVELDNQCQPGDVLTVKKSKGSEKLAKANLTIPTLSNIPQHLDFDKEKLTAKVLRVIDREWVALKLNELLVIEHYSRKI